MEEAIRRARLYEQAGADIIFVESLESVEEMRMVNEAIAKPTIANMVETGRTPLLTAAQLQEIGYDMVVFPISTLFVAAKAVYDMLMDLRANGTTRNCLDEMMSFSQFNDFIGLPLERTGGEPVRQRCQKAAVSETCPARRDADTQSI